MEEVKILYLNAETMESVELGQLLVNRLQGKGVIIESYPATVAVHMPHCGPSEYWRACLISVLGRLSFR